MNRFDGHSVKRRIFGYMLIFIAIPIVILWFFQIVFLENFYTNIKIWDVRTTMETIARNLEDRDIAALMDNIARQSDVNIRIYGHDGSQAYAAGGGDPGGAPVDRESVLRYYALTRENRGVRFTVYDRRPLPGPGGEPGGQPLPRGGQIGKGILCTMIVPLSSGEEVMVMIDAVITPVEATVHTLTVQLACITVILLALSLFIALLMSRRIARPIIRITASAKELAEGNYDTVFDAHGYREIAELNKTLNYAASEMSKVERLRRELIANVSHDLRTPLTMVTGYAEAMRDIPGENTPENAQVIIDEATRLSRLVSDMLDISRFESGGRALSADTCNLTQSIREVMERYALLMSQGGYKIDFRAERDVYVNCDHGRMMQVMYNLINNAVHYTGEDKTASVRQIVKGDTVRIEVADTGRGIAEEDLPYIWDRYYRVDKTHKRAAIGTGLGLSIVRSILRLHNAEYGVDSAPGAGSVFWFELKIEAPPENTP